MLRPLAGSETTDTPTHRHFVGTLRYAPPELLLRRERSEDAEAWRAIDIYQIGTVLYELIQGARLFGHVPEDPYAEVVVAVLQERPSLVRSDVGDDVSSQTDVLLLYRREPGSRVVFPEGHALVECKYRKKPVSASMVREFGARCVLRNVPLGILIAKNKITGTDVVGRALRHAERERRDFLSKGAHILVLSAEELRGKSRELRGLEGLLLDDYEHLRFGKRS